MLGIESSCDDTAAAVVRYEPNNDPLILSNEVFCVHTFSSKFF